MMRQLVIGDDLLSLHQQLGFDYDASALRLETRLFLIEIIGSELEHQLLVLIKCLGTNVLQCRYLTRDPRIQYRLVCFQKL